MKGDTWNSPQDPLGMYLNLFESFKTVVHKVEGVVPTHRAEKTGREQKG